MKKNGLAIVGGSASRDNAPYDDPEWEVHGMNEMGYPGEIDVWWEMHPMSVQSERELEWLKNCQKPVYVLDRKDALANGVTMAVEYPYEEIQKQPWAIPYFCCSMAYQIAWAIFKDYSTIGLYGLRMDIGSPRERTVESACIQHWLGVAKGRGIEVIWHEHPAYNRLLYGYDYHSEVADIDSWLYQLAIHTIYRLGGKHIWTGGDNDPIRKPDSKKLRKV